jgi:hypothetical protein
MAARAEQGGGCQSLDLYEVCCSLMLRISFRLGLKEPGSIEGQNVTIEYLSGENDSEPVSVIIANVIAALAAKAATTTVPIVLAIEPPAPD